MGQLKTAAAELNVEAVEATLCSLWKTVAKDGSICLKRRMINLLIVVASSKAAEIVAGVIDQIAASCSGRFVIVVLNPDPESLLRWENGNTVCQVAVCETNGICYERIIIPYVPGQAKELPHYLRSLLLQGLPVVFWWRYIFNPKEWLFEELSQLAERTIIDSVTLKNPAAGMEKILALCGKTVVRDINWARIQPWRMALAGIYDVAGYHPYLSRLSKIQIDYAHQLSRQNAVNNSQVLLLFGWLASRLQWQPIGNLTEDVPESRYELGLVGQGRQMVSRFSVHPALDHSQSGIRAVYLMAEESPCGTFAVMRCDDGKHIRTKLALADLTAAEKVTCLQDGDEAELIAGELFANSLDKVYLETLQFLGEHAKVWSK